MTRRIRLIMFWITLVFDIGVILFCIFRAEGLPLAVKLVSLLLPWLMLGLCHIRWPRTRPSTQAWVGMLVLVLSLTILAGILAAELIP